MSNRTSLLNFIDYETLKNTTSSKAIDERWAVLQKQLDLTLFVYTALMVRPVLFDLMDKLMTLSVLQQSRSF